MKMRHDMVTGIVGLLTCIFFFIMTQQVRQPANLLEPGEIERITVFHSSAIFQ